jgi:hypothetical protein
MLRAASILSLTALLAACAPDPCSKRCPNDTEPSATDTARCRDTQSRINSASGPCANEIRTLNACVNNNTVCNSSGRSEFASGTCSSQTSAVAECCLRNIGQAPACALR